MRDCMHVYALLPEDGVRRLRAGVPTTWVLHAMTSASELVTVLRSKRCDVLVLDPSVIRLDCLDSVVGAVTGTGSGLLLYTPIDRLGAGAILGVVERVSADLLGLGAEDEESLLREKVLALARASVPAMVLRSLAPAVRRLPRALEVAVVGLFGYPPIPDSPGSFLGSATGHRRTAERRLRREGLASPERLFIGARLARVWEAVKDGQDVAWIAERGGFPSASALRAQFRRLVGAPLTHARELFDAGDIANRLSLALQTDPTW